jgi:hypothetical protein
MLKKIFITAAAAAAVSVPLAGVAWADPNQPNNPPGHPEINPVTGELNKPGIPGEVGAVGDLFGTNPNGTGNPLPPGEVFSGLKKGTSVTPPFPGKNTPERYANAINGLLGTSFDTLQPGLGVKSGTPACASGHTATDPAVNGGNPLCN